MRTLFVMLVLVAGSATRASSQGNWPTLRLTPSLRIDGARNDLSDIAFVAIARDGAAAIGLPGENDVRFYRADGTSLGRFGGKGDGPGEFRILGRWAMWEADSLWVFDNALQRMTMISPQRELVRSVTWSRMGLPPKGGNANTRMSGIGPRAVRRGDVLGVGMRPSAPGGFQVVVGWVSLAGEIRSIVGEYLFDIGGCNTTGTNGQPLVLPFCAFATSGFSPSGDRVALVSATAAQQDRGAFSVIALSASGDTLFSREFEAPVDRLAPEDLERLIASWQPSAATAARFRGSPLRRRFPTTLNVVVGGDGSIWVEHSGRNSNLWNAIDRRGQPIGLVRLPVASRIVAADAGKVWVVEADGDGFESVVRYQFKQGR